MAACGAAKVREAHRKLLGQPLCRCHRPSDTQLLAPAKRQLSGCMGQLPMRQQGTRPRPHLLHQQRLQAVLRRYTGPSQLRGTGAHLGKHQVASIKRRCSCTEEVLAGAATSSICCDGIVREEDPSGSKLLAERKVHRTQCTSPWLPEWCRTECTRRCRWQGHSRHTQWSPRGQRHWASPVAPAPTTHYHPSFTGAAASGSFGLVCLLDSWYLNLNLNVL
jgi:hypothetical protein